MKNKPIDIESYLDKPFHVIDILPWQVPADSDGQYFAMEKYFLKAPQFNQIRQQFSNLLIKLNCYEKLSVYTPYEEWVDNPQPEALVECMLAGKFVYVFMEAEDALIVFSGEDHYMTLYNPNENLLKLVTALASAEGLFVSARSS